MRQTDDDARQAAADDGHVVVDADEPTPTDDAKADPSACEDAFGVELDCRKIAIIFAVLALAGTSAGVIAYVFSTGELSGGRPGSRITN